MATVKRLSEWRSGGSYLWVEVGVLHTHGGIHQTSSAQLCSSPVLGDSWRLAAGDRESLPEQQGRNSELRDDNNRRLSAVSGLLGTDAASTHLSVKVSSCQADGAQADSAAALSDPGDDLLVLHVLHRLPIDGQDQISILHSGRLGRTPHVHLPQDMNWDGKRSLAYETPSRM